MEYGLMPGRYPAIVKTYNQARRTCRVEIPGLTDGGDVLPEAEIEYPIGDKSRSGKWETEIEILPGDTVWVSFIGGDPRYPIITGWRNPQSGNSVDWRRWHHKNIEHIADQLMIELAGNDIRHHTAKNFQVDADGNILLRALGAILIQSIGGGRVQSTTGGDTTFNCQDRLQVSSNNTMYLRSLEGQIILKSATGTLVI